MIRPGPGVTVRPIFNKRLSQWWLCHDRWCGPGETSIVATILSSGDDELDKAWAEELARRFNGVP